MLKVLCNFSERLTYLRLVEVCEPRSAIVFAKVRLADVLPIKEPGLSAALFQFALQSHYDFVVTDLNQRPLFAVEFDGPLHADLAQVERDARKNELSEKFGLHLLRVKSTDLYRDEQLLDRLTWNVERWFAERELPIEGDRSMPPPVCPRHNIEMVKRHGRFGPFYGCVKYNDPEKCPETRDIPRSSGSERPPEAASRFPWVVVRFAGGAFLVLLVVVVLLTQSSLFDRPVPQAKGAPPAKPVPGANDPPATADQMSYLSKLIKKRGWADDERDAQIEKILGYPRPYSELRKREATKVLDVLEISKK